MADELNWLSAAKLVKAYKKRKLSPVEVARSCLDQIARHDQALNAMCLVDDKSALKQAKASEARWHKGKPLGAVDGVPALIKDLILVKGWPTLRGSKTIDRNQAWDQDGPSVARLREAGAIFIGLTTVPEFGWKGVTDSPLTGITRNPWDPTRTSGGSSGGAASSVAVGMGALAVGSDGGGSIRIPSSLTGVFGHKPTVGRVPYYPPAAVGTCSTAGPMTRTVRDAALMMNVVAAYDPRDWVAVRAEGGDYLASLDDGVAGLRIALCPGLGYAAIDADVEKAVRRAAAVFADLGAIVEEVDKVIDSPRTTYETFYKVAMARTYGPMT